MFAIKALNAEDTTYNYVYACHKQTRILRGIECIPCIIFRCPGDAVVFTTLEAARKACEAISKYLCPELELRIEEWDRPKEGPIKFIRVVENYNEHKVEES